MKRATPERMCLLAEWGSKLPYRRVAELLNVQLAEAVWRILQEHWRLLLVTLRYSLATLNL